MIDKESVRKVCIDDFALKKRYRYGTIMVDIESRRVIDILESRDAEKVTEWLKTFPNIEVVSRDGSQTYAKAIRDAHPTAIQVSDRFHLIKNLTDCAKQHIMSLVGATFRIPIAGGEAKAEAVKNDNAAAESAETAVITPGGYFDKGCRLQNDLPERLHKESAARRERTAQKAKELATRGFSVSEIASEMGVTPPTVKRYLSSAFDTTNAQFGSFRESKLKPYTDAIDAMLKEKRTFREIEAAITESGYRGAASTIRMYATRQRRIQKDARSRLYDNTERIERKWVTKLLYSPIEKVRGITAEQVAGVIREFPVIGDVYAIVRSFKELMFAKHADKLAAWILSAKNLDIPTLSGFAASLIADFEAVQNAVRLEYNNGLAEGSVNKLKLVKRIMFGRSSFALLRRKVLA